MLFGTTPLANCIMPPLQKEQSGAWAAGHVHVIRELLEGHCSPTNTPEVYKLCPWKTTDPPPVHQPRAVAQEVAGSFLVPLSVMPDPCAALCCPQPRLRTQHYENLTQQGQGPHQHQCCPLQEGPMFLPQPSFIPSPATAVRLPCICAQQDTVTFACTMFLFPYSLQHATATLQHFENRPATTSPHQHWRLGRHNSTEQWPELRKVCGLGHPQRCPAVACD
jgi:hypothetical protein